MAHNDPPIDIGGGSIIARTPFWHIWHRRSSQICYAARTLRNDQIYITDGDGKKVLWACVSPEWTCSFSTVDADDVVRLGTNEVCDLGHPVDPAGNIYLRITGVNKYNGQWKHPWCIKWWEVNYIGSDIHITRIDLTTLEPESGVSRRPTKWTREFEDHRWHVRVGQAPPGGG
jgi:hypothetical protein